jgi:hypothetical protein
MAFKTLVVGRSAGDDDADDDAGDADGWGLAE